MTGKRLLERGQVVPWQDERIRKLVRRLAAAGGQRHDRLVGLGPVADEHVVEPAVVVPLELHEQRPAGEGSGESQRGLHRLGARVGEDDPLDAGEHGAHELGQFDLPAVLGAEGKAPGELIGHGRDHRGMGIAEDQRPPGERVVEEPVAVGVEIVRALAPLEKQWRRRSGPSHAARHAHGEGGLRTTEQIGRGREVKARSRR